MERKSIYTLFLVLLCYYKLISGTTGKLTGTIIDKETKEPIIGATIYLKELNNYTTTDEKGQFTFIMLSPGIYELKISAIGYKEYLLNNIIIHNDQTTKIKISLEQSPFTYKPVEITLKKSDIYSDYTYSIKTIEPEDYKHLPKIDNLKSILSYQPGFINYKNEIHLRGGRAGEILYVLDGIPIKDILFTGKNAIDINPNSIKELNIINSGFSAEYGNAESGVINITTKNGSEKYMGSLQFQTDNFTKYSNDEYFFSLSLGGPDPLTNLINELLNTQNNNKLKFFSSLSFQQTNTDYKFNNTYYKNFKSRSIDIIGGLFKIKYKEKQKNNYNGTIKINYENNNYNLMFSYTSTGEREYRYDIHYKNRMDSALLDENSAKHLSLKFTHLINNNLFYSIIIGVLKRNWNLSVSGLTPPEYNPIWYSQDIDNDGFYDLSMAQFWNKSRTNIYTIKNDFNYNISNSHYLKAGFEFNYEEIFGTEIQYPGNTPDKILPGEYPNYGEYHWNLNNYSINGSIFVQDKIDYESFIINTGLRLEFFSPGKQVNSEKYKSAWEEATQLKDENGNTIKLKVENLRLYISPRLGISYPITDKSSLFFNYGHFYQLPERQYIFRDPYSAKGWIGNPNLKSPKTICYEFGFNNRFLDDYFFSLKGFYKDYFDYIGSLEVGPPARKVFMFYNSDYAYAKGFEINVNKNLSANYSFDLNYTYSISKGRSESPFEESYSIWQGQGFLPQEVRMPWDQRHNLNCIFSYSIEEENSIKFFNNPILKNTSISTKINFGSGFPYTPTGKNLRLNKNTKELPYTLQVDLRIEKNLKIYDNLNSTIFIDIINLLNRKNVNEINPLTGQPYKYGDVYDLTNKRILTYREILSKIDESNFLGMRQILIGILINY